MNKKIVLLIVVLFVGMVFLSGCNETNESDILEGLEYKNYEYGFGFNPPTGWTETDSDSVGDIVFFTKDTDEDFKVAIGIGYRYLEGKNLNQYINDAYEAYNNDEYITNFSVISEKETTVSDKEALETFYTLDFEGVKFKTSQYLMKKDSEMILLFTYTSKIEDFDNYLADFEKIIDSLVII